MGDIVTGTDGLCQCPKCGRVHRDMQAGPPPESADLYSAVAAQAGVTREEAKKRLHAVAYGYDPRPWQRIHGDNFPKRKWVEVCGASGYTDMKWFSCIAKYDDEYRPLTPWLDVMLAPLSDNGWVPLFFREVDLPPGQPAIYSTGS